MSSFNQKSRTRNSILTAFVSEISTFSNLILGFVYRSIFLTILTAEYLGINGLFTNILQLLSLADLGIASAIVYRFYKPINEGDVLQVGRLMNFFKTVYRIILIVIMGIGVALMPFLPMLISDSSEIPSDVNLYFVYFLFLLQTASSYMFAYRQTILTADQKQYKLSWLQLIATMTRYFLQILILVFTHNYTLTLMINIGTNICSNVIISFYVKRQYKEVFAVKEKLSKEERKEILHDTKACMFHKVGGVVLNSTDNVVLSKFAGLFSVGVYSNYSMIISNVTKFSSQLLSNMTASLGNAHVSLDRDGRYRIYRNLNFINFWVGSTLTVCIYVLINPFICLWVGDDLQLDSITVIALCAQFYFELIRQINMSFTSASGLFVKDMYRPFLESAINLIVSILLVIKIGIAGVFIGTVVSCLSTVTWREPYILYKFEFQRGMKDYWVDFITFLLITVIDCAVLGYFISNRIAGIFTWILAGFITLIITELTLILLYGRREEFKYLRNVVKKILYRIIKRKRTT